MTQSMLEQLEQLGLCTVRELSLAQVCTFRVGGIGAVGIYPRSEQELCTAVGFLQKQGIAFEIIGRGSNLFFGDGFYEGALLFTKGLAGVEQQDNTLYAESGITLAALATLAADRALSGLAFARGIPGTLGGAVFMNAGAYGSSMAEVVRSSRALNRETGQIEVLTDHRFGYRHSIYMERPELICLSAELSLCRGDREEILSHMKELSAKRSASQPLEYPNAGSYFKRPEGFFAGKLIEDAGLKGASMGGAQVSEKHAGFLINSGGATAAELLALEELVRETVQRKFGVTLEREVRFVETASVRQEKK